MKKNKSIVFGLLSVLSISGISAIILANTFDIGTLVNAEKATAPCELVWDFSTSPTLQGDKWISTAKNGVTQLTYTGMSDIQAKDNNVTLDLDGTIETTNQIWDGKTNGVINSIESITVWFEDKAGSVWVPDEMSFDPNEGQNVDLGALVLYAGTSAGFTTVKSRTKLTSGVAVDLASKQDMRADRFKIEFDKDMFAPADSTGTCNISKIAVSATMEVRHGVKIKDKAGTLVETYKVAGNKLGAKIEKVDPWNNNWLAGSQIALKVKENADGAYITKQNITATGATITEKTLDGDTKPTLVVTVGNQDATVTVNAYTMPAVDPYPSAEYTVVGKYKVYDTTAQAFADLELKEDGTYTLGATSGKFTSTKEAPNKATFIGELRGRPVDLTVAEDGFAVLHYAAHSDTAADTTYIGCRATKTPTMNVINTMQSEWQGYIGTYSDGGAEQTVMVFDKNVWIDGVDGIEIIGNKPTLAESDIIKIKATRPLATPDAEFPFVGPVAKVIYETTATEKTGSVFFKPGYQTTKLTTTKPDSDFYGVYTCEGQPDLILDGFYTYTLGNETGTFETLSSPYRVVINGKQYKVNSNHTYEPIILKVNTLADGEIRNYKSEKGEIDVTFNGNTITDNIIKVTETYKFDELTGVISAKLEDNSGMGGVGRTYKFTLDQTTDTIKVTSAQKYTTYDTGYMGWQSNDDEEDILAAYPATLTLQKLAAHPFETPKTYTDGTHTFVITKNHIEIPATVTHITSNRNASYELDGNTLTFVYSYHDPYGWEAGAVAEATAVIIFNQDFTSFSFKESMNYSVDDSDPESATGVWIASISNTKVFNVQ